MPTDTEILHAELPAADARNTPPALGIPIKQTYAELAACVARALAGHPQSLFYKDGDYGTVIIDHSDQKYLFHKIDPDRFTTWLEEQNICYFYALSKKPAATEANPDPQPIPVRTSLSPAQAKIILASDAIRFSVPEIKEIAELRFPLSFKQPDNTYRFAPAPIGYDPTTKIYSIDFLPIDWSPHMAWPLQKCLKAISFVFGDFPLDGGKIPLQHSRSFAAIVTAMLGQFLRHSIPLFPMVAINANQPGTGKSFCAQTILAPFYGLISANNYLEDDNEMRKYLNSAIMEGQSVFFLDDIATLAGRVLPRYVTMRKIRDRVLGKNTTFEKENRTQFFVTGNQLKTSTDIERRVLPIDLFIAEDAPSHTATLSNLKEEHFSLPEWRKDMLRALWGLVLNWVKLGCPRKAKPMSSFKTYTDICSNIVIAAGLADPLSPRQVNLDTGDTMKAALIELVIYLADQISPPEDDPYRPHTGLQTTYKLEEVINIATEQQLLDTITNAARDPKAKIGRQMRALIGRRFTDSYGRQFQIGDATRTRAARTAYPFLILSEPTRTLEDDADIATPFD